MSQDYIVGRIEWLKWRLTVARHAHSYAIVAVQLELAFRYYTRLLLSLPTEGTDS